MLSLSPHLKTLIKLFWSVKINLTQE
uniref:Uncharacterized protein n=1 Tax=Anguilla anguilla TaxID=7936 RepID=A0A0E9PE84_ANGAN